MALDISTLRITPEILSLIAELTSSRALGAPWGELRLIDSPVHAGSTIESIGSSMPIESAKLSNRDVEKLLSNLRIRSFTSRDEQEVAA